MHGGKNSYAIFPLGDAGLTIDFGNVIDTRINEEVIMRFRDLQRNPLPGMIEAIPAYSSLTIFFNPLFFSNTMLPGYDQVRSALEVRLAQPVPSLKLTDRAMRIPVCYESEFAPDLPALADARGLSIEDVITLHTEQSYRVYMLGFLPGFAYMGEVNEKIAMPRKTIPSMVEPGSVGIAGRQTGIYPLPSPGGWSIIGRTPLKLFDREKREPILLDAGDEVIFYAISSNEFKNF